MKKIIILMFVLAVSNGINAQEEINVTGRGILRVSLEFTPSDSIMIDSIQQLIKASETLGKTLNSLSNSNYSEHLIRYSFREYAKHLDKTIESNIHFLSVHGVSKGLFIPMSQSLVYYSDQRTSPIQSQYLKAEISKMILKFDYLSNCEYLTFKGVPYYYTIQNRSENTAYEEALYYDHIGYILASSIDEIKDVLDSKNECYKSNIDILLKKSLSFRKAYNKQ